MKVTKNQHLRLTGLLLAASVGLILGKPAPVVGAATTTEPATTTAATTNKASTKIVEQPFHAVGWVAYVPHYGIELWRSPVEPRGMTGRKLAHGSSWKIFAAYREGDHYWYKLGTNQWMDGRYISLTPVSADRKVDAKIKRNVVRISGTAPVYAVPNGRVTGKTLKNRTYWKFGDRKISGDHMWYSLGGNQWVKDSWAKEAVPYQNPSRYYQVNYQTIKPTGQVGYNLIRGSEGIKTWLTLRALGLNSGYANMSGYAQSAVASFQRRHGLPATGVVNQATWVKLGFKASTWTSIDSWIYPLQAPWYTDRSAHIEAMIKAAYSYLGKPFIVGASSSYAYGVDCSGLVTQALYAGGINPLPVSSIQHAQPGNEWNSRQLAVASGLKQVSYASRQRGDLIFYTNPSDHRVWHVAIYLGNNQVIESWPSHVMVQPIKNGQRNWVTSVSRPFL
ncbi:C40 family peptidase [Lapidilactobacillus achengensis]|uniref:C40 family peptidase n=1 Tax=Lapidilactobacillus achengensis TaxID=2486000 RepID=A0ABW1ULG7_9LACO|nr:NlpC/P60 family protein [Lapidilactobacillus achengensis]